MGTTNIYGAGAQITTNLDGVATNVTDIDALEAGITVEVEAAGDTAAPNVIVDTESHNLIVNEATLGEKNFHTLPAAVAGIVLTFVCNHTDGIRVTANTGDTIRLNGQVSIAAGFAESVLVGSVVKLIAIDTTEWIAITIIGTWAVETS